jgi:hypothetical protein
MAYNKFKIKDLETKLGIKAIKESWLPKEFEPFPEDNLLQQTLNSAENEALYSEKARSELIISPTLQAFRRRNATKLSVFSGYEFNVEKELSLQGYCDFIFSLSTNTLQIEAPAVFVVEAKKMEPDLNDFAQCGAEMYASRLFNEKAGKNHKVIYGCATSGFSWGFLKLEGETLAIDQNYIPLTFKNPYLVLEVLQWILNQTLALPQ